VHSGRPTLTETGHVGLSVHTAASSCHAAHGGQIVLSSPVQAALLDPLADGVTLRSLGAWRFHGIREPQSLFQLDVGDLPATFPPLRSGDPVT
jgi:class 3 adenylate cyclase